MKGLQLYSPGELARAFARIEPQHDYWVGIDAAPDLRVVVRFGRTDEGRFICTGLVIGVDQVRELRARDLHNRLRLGELTARVSEGVREAQDRRRTGAPLVLGTRLATFGLAGLVAESLQQPVYRDRPGPRGWSREHYENVARRYRAAAKRSSRGVVSKLAREWPTSEPTMRRWVKRSRGMGLLKTRTARSTKRQGGRKR